MNAHLNDMLQQNGLLWKEFHDTHIADMRRLLNEQLVPQGYEARLVSGLQLTSLDLDTLNYDPLHPIQPDVAIRQRSKPPVSSPGSGIAQLDRDNLTEHPIPE